MTLKPTYIYVIKCPITNHVVYVGQSKNPDARHKQHYCGYYNISSWMKAMRSIKLIPVFEIVDSTYGDGGKIERNLIAYYANLNQANFNTNGNCNAKIGSKDYSIKADTLPAIVERKKFIKDRLHSMTYYGAFNNIPIWAVEKAYYLLTTPIIHKL